MDVNYGLSDLNFIGRGYTSGKTHFIGLEKPFKGQKTMPTAGKSQNVLTQQQEQQLNKYEPKTIQTVEMMPIEETTDSENEELFKKDDEMKAMLGSGLNKCACGKSHKQVLKLMGGFHVGQILRKSGLNYVKNYLKNIGKSTFKLVSSKAPRILIEIGVSILGEEARPIITTLVYAFGARAIDMIRKYSKKGIKYIVNKLEGQSLKKRGGGKRTISSRQQCRYCPSFVEMSIKKGKITPEDFKLMGRGFADDLTNGLVWFSEEVLSPVIEAVVPSVAGKALAAVPKLNRILAESLSPNYHYQDPFGRDDETSHEQDYSKARDMNYQPRKPIKIKPIEDVKGRGYTLIGGSKAAQRTLKTTVGDLFDITYPVLLKIIEDRFGEEEAAAQHHHHHYHQAPGQPPRRFSNALSSSSSDSDDDNQPRLTYKSSAMAENGEMKMPSRKQTPKEQQLKKGRESLDKLQHSLNIMRESQIQRRKKIADVREGLHKINQIKNGTGYKEVKNKVKEFYEENKHIIKPIAGIAKAIALPLIARKIYKNYKESKTPAVSDEMLAVAHPVVRGRGRPKKNAFKAELDEEGKIINDDELRDIGKDNSGRGKITDFLKKHKKAIGAVAGVAGTVATAALAHKLNKSDYPEALSKVLKKPFVKQPIRYVSLDDISDDERKDGRGKITDFLKKHKKAIGAVAGVAGTVGAAALAHKLHKSDYPGELSKALRKPFVERDGRGKITDFLKKHKKAIGAVASVAGTVGAAALAHKLHKSDYPGELSKALRKPFRNNDANLVSNWDEDHIPRNMNFDEYYSPIGEGKKKTGKGIKDFLKKHKKAIGAVAGVAGTVATAALAHKLHKSDYPEALSKALRKPFSSVEPDYNRHEPAFEDFEIVDDNRSYSARKKPTGRGKKGGGYEGQDTKPKGKKTLAKLVSNVDLVDRVPNGQKASLLVVPKKDYKNYNNGKVKTFNNYS